MTFVEAVREAISTGCAIRPVGISDSCILVRSQGPRNDPILYTADIGYTGNPRPSPIAGAYVKACYYLRDWETFSNRPKQRTLADLFPEFDFAAKEHGTRLKISDLLGPTTTEKKWRFSDLQ